MIIATRRNKLFKRLRKYKYKYKVEPRDVEEELTVSTSETNRKPETQSASTPQMPPPHSIILSSPISETKHLLSIMYFRRSKCLAFTW